MSEVPDHLKFCDSHEWGDPGDADAAGVGVGIFDRARAERTEVVSLELPKPGRRIEKGESVSGVGTFKAADEAPADHPAAVNNDPSGEGWMFKVELSDAGEREPLMDSEANRGRIGGSI